MTQARAAKPTVAFVDEYCQLYHDLFPDGRSFEHFTRVQLGMLSETKRKTLPAIAKAAGESDPQALHHLVANAPWSVEHLRERRLSLLKQALAGRAFILCIDQTGDRKKRQNHRLCGLPIYRQRRQTGQRDRLGERVRGTRSDHLPLTL